MDYQELNLKSGDLLTANHMAHIEKGIDDVTAEVDKLKNIVRLPISEGPNKQLITDNKGEWKQEDRTHYSYIEESEFFPETDLILLSSNPDEVTVFIFNQNRFIAEPVVDEICEFTYNKTTYFLKTKQTFVEDNYMKIGPIYFWGNGELLGLNEEDDENCSFVFMYIPEKFAHLMEANCGFITSDNIETATIKIKGPAEFIKPLNSKFLKNLRGQETITFTKLEDSSNFISSTTFEDLWNKDVCEIQNTVQILESKGQKIDNFSINSVVKTLVNDERVIQFEYMTIGTLNESAINVVQWNEFEEAARLKDSYIFNYETLRNKLIPYIVNVNMENNILSADHYAQEIYEAGLNREVWLKVGEIKLPLTHSSTDLCIFSSVLPDVESDSPIFVTFKITTDSVNGKIISLEAGEATPFNLLL